jgi:hypothetical protein
VIGPRELAGHLVRFVREGDVVDVGQMSQDPVAALDHDPSVRIVWVDSADLPSDCSIAAAYDRATVPARLLVSQDASPGRRRFSVLHEYGHHLRNQVPAVMEALFSARDGGAGLEERMCDEFAGTVLVPDDLLNRVLGSDMTARSVLGLMATISASAEACAVAVARRLSAPGYVMLLSRNGTATFTAHNGDVFRVRRDTQQQGLLSRAASGEPVRGRSQVRYGTGNYSREMFLDAATGSGRTVAVLVTDSPPWGGFTAGYKRGPEGSTIYCENCDHEFTTFDPSCRSCGQPPCPNCRHCECPVQGSRGDRQCDKCFLIQPAKAFSNADSATCNECS